jgi:hypothetical protein
MAQQFHQQLSKIFMVDLLCNIMIGSDGNVESPMSELLRKKSHLGTTGHRGVSEGNSGDEIHADKRVWNSDVLCGDPEPPKIHTRKIPTVPRTSGLRAETTQIALA